MDAQLYIGTNSIEGHFPIKNRESPWVKPIGGLWTSTYDSVTGSAWVRWCFAEDWCIPDDEMWNCTLLHPATCRVLEIDTFEDLVTALQRYGRPDAPLLESGYSSTKCLGFRPPIKDNLDFERISEDYDAIHLTDRGQGETRLTIPNLYGWDCESTVWFRPKFEKIEHIGHRRFRDMSRGE